MIGESRRRSLPPPSINFLLHNNKKRIDAMWLSIRRNVEGIQQIPTRAPPPPRWGLTRILFLVTMATDADVCTTLNHPFCQRCLRPPLGDRRRAGVRERKGQTSTGRTGICSIFSLLPFSAAIRRPERFVVYGIIPLLRGKVVLNREVVVGALDLTYFGQTMGSWNTFSWGLKMSFECVSETPSEYFRRLTSV